MSNWPEKILASQKGNLVLWAAIAFAGGIGLYFGLRAEPPLFLTGGIFAAALVTGGQARRWRNDRPLLWAAGMALFLFAAGLAAAQAKTFMLRTVMLDKAVKTGVSGTVESIDALEPGKGVRVVLYNVAADKLPPGQTPQKIRLKIRKGAEAIKPGDRISVFSQLNPPSAPVAPHAFDFQRYAYFERIGAFGFAFKATQVVSGARLSGFPLWLADLRQAMNARIEKHVHYPASGIAVALVTGGMTGISKEDYDAFRVSGLAHMLSISGLHIGLVAGLFFFTSRLLMALMPPLALHYPIKKIAAMIALAAALFYTVLSGAPVPTVRSMVMTGIALVAVLLDRAPFSIRTVAVAALAVLLFWPEALWGASFQMSFAAVTALIVFYDTVREKLPGLYANAGFLRRAALYVAGVCATTLAASAATIPFSLYHFQQTGFYGIAANMAAEPVMAFVVMPAAIIACLLMPSGLENLPLQAMEYGVNFIRAVAYKVASWPMASLLVPALPLSFLLLVVAAALLLMFGRGRGRAAGLLPLAAALLVAYFHVPPDILVSADAKLLAVRNAQGRYQLSSLKADHFSADTWLRMNGQAAAERWPQEGQDADGLLCGEGGCRLERNGHKVAFSLAAYTHPEDCAWADILIAQDPVRTKPCRAAAVIDRFSVWRDGAHAVWLDGRIESVGDVRGHRPWTVSNRR